MATEIHNNIKKYCKDYLKTVLLLMKHDKDLCELAKVIDIEYFNCDDYYDDYGNNILVSLSLYIPPEEYSKIVSKKVTEKKLQEMFNESNDRESEFYFSRVKLVPNHAARKDAREAVAKSEAHFWTPKHFKAFISHLASHKESATNLKKFLEYYGITAFVAHVDIPPSKEWEKEILTALFSADFLIALVEDDFNRSNWCNQEVGIAIGRGITILPILRTEKTYGFLSDYHHIELNKDEEYKAKLIAKKVHKSLLRNSDTSEAYIDVLINLLLTSNTVEDTRKWIKILSDVENLEKSKVLQVKNNLSFYCLGRDDAFLEIINKWIEENGVEPYVQPKVEDDDDDSLPF